MPRSRSVKDPQLMLFSSLKVKNFRCFESLKVEGLDRVNLFLGPNNVGKTALLEALFLLVGPTTPELSLKLSAFRGIDQFKNDPEEAWGWLFYGRNVSKHIDLEIELPKERSRHLTMSIDEATEVPTKPGATTNVGKTPPVSSTSRGGPGQLVLKYKDEVGRQYTSKAFFRDAGIVIERKHPVKLPISVYVSSRGPAALAESAEQYSNLEAVGKEAGVLKALQAIEPRLSKLAVLVTAGLPILHGDIGIGRMVPLPVMGDGVGRLATLLLAVATAPKGIVLIDEIENGLYYAVMQKIWSAITDFARETEVQLFATTHSWECLKAAHESFSAGDKYDFRLHRIDRKGAKFSVTTFDRDMVETALTSGIELR